LRAPRPADEVGRGHGSNAALVAALLALGAAVRLLRFWGPFALWAHWDELRLALPALAILDGELPVHHLGVEYMGAGPAYPLAVWFALAGGSPLALDVFAYAVGLAIFATGWLLARRLLPPLAARFALLALVAPPLLLAGWSLNGNLNYPFLLVLGNVFLLLTHRLVEGRPGPAAAWLVLGLVAGVGIWTNLLFVVYLAPLGWLVLRRGLVRRPRTWLIAAGAVLGSLPMWLYELDAFPSSRFAVAESGEPAGTVGARGLMVLTGALPSLLGVEPEALRPDVLGMAAAGLLAVAAVAVVRAARRPGETGAVLWAVALANVALVVLSPRSTLGTGVRYLLPLYSVLPCWIGAALAALWVRWRLVGIAALALWLGVHAAANWVATVGTTPPGVRRWAPLRALVAPVAATLERHGARHVYWADVPTMKAFELTYLTGGRIVAADPWREEAVAYARLVDGAVDPPFLMIPEREAALASSLAGLGRDVRATTVGSLRLLEATPAVGQGFAPLPRRGWRATASENDRDAPLVLDGDAATAWRTDEKRAGQWLAVDLAAETAVARVDLLAIDWRELPVGFRVELSRDGERWEPVAAVPRYWGPLFLAGPHPVLKVRRGRVQAVFRPTRARWLRVVQTGADPSGWTVRELFVYGPAPAVAAPSPGELAAALAREGVEWVYTDAWAAAAVGAESHGRIRSQESNLFVNAYGRDRPDPTRLERFRPTAGRALLLGADTDAEAIRATLAGRGTALRETRAAGGYRLLVLGPAPSPRRVPIDGWSATASEAGELAWRAIDGDLASAWTTAGPAGPATSLTLDLRIPRTVRALRVRPGPGEGGAPELLVEGSPDGAQWSPPGPLAWMGPLYWTGAELLRNGSHAWDVAFPAMRLRYLRLRPAAEQSAPWIVREVECFE
jgi:hypothetical protein